MSSKRNKINWLLALSTGYLTLQIVLVIFARFSSNRYFTWAPHDIQTEYQLHVITGSEGVLNDSALYGRYGMRTHGWIDLPVNHIKEWLVAYEEYNPCSGDSISLRTSVNGAAWQSWTFKGEKCHD